MRVAFFSSIFYTLLMVTVTPLAMAGDETAQRARDLESQGRYVEAAILLNTVGLNYEREAKYLPARNAFERSISLLTRGKGDNDPGLLDPLNNLAALLYESGQYAAAEPLVRRHIAIRNATGARDADTGIEMLFLGKIYLNEQKYALARQSAEDSLKIFEDAGEPVGTRAALAYSILGVVYTEYGEHQGAEQSLRRSLSILEEALDPRDYRIGEGMANLGFLYANDGALEKAEPLLESAHGFFRASSRNSMFTREFLMAWAEIERKSGKKKKAKELVKEAQALTATSAEGSISRYVVDASRLR